MRPLSHSSISMYRQCPLLYKLKYVDGRREEKKYYLSWGNSLHDTLEYLYGIKVPPPPSLEDVMAFYEENWLSEGYESPEQEANYFAEGRRILTDYYKANIGHFRPPVAVERQFNLDIESVKLTGFFDRIDKLDDGTLAIVDYKSSRRLFDKDYLANDLQLTFYQLAAEKLWDLPISKLTLYHLRSNTPCSTGPRTTEQLDTARKLIIDVAKRIEDEIFDPRENQFCPCDFPEDCPYYSHLHPEVGARRAVPLPNDIDIKQVIEEYATQKSLEKEVKIRIEKLAEIIRRFCASEQLKRVYGVEHAVTLSETKRVSYDETLVRNILEPLGLWERVLDFDQKALECLTKEESLPPSILKALEAAKSLTPSYRMTLKKLLEEELAD